MADQKIIPGAKLGAMTTDELVIELAKQRTRIVLAMGGGPQERLDDNIPLPGTVRQVTSYKRGTGSDGLAIAAAQFVQLVQPDPARIAGNLQNIGANPLFAYMMAKNEIPAQQQGTITSVLCAYLAANGSWDFTISKDVWCGPVTLYSPLGTTVVWGVH